MSQIIGVAIHRRAGYLVAVDIDGDNPRILEERRLDRPPGQSVAAILQELLKPLAPSSERRSLALALSQADLACADAWGRPSGVKPPALQRLAPSLCESRSAGEALETLSSDAVAWGKSVQAIAIRGDLLREIRSAAGSTPLSLVTPIPAALAGVIAMGHEIALTAGGERFLVRRSDTGVDWRSFPVEAPDDTGILPWKGLEIPIGLAAALAAAVADPDAVPNALTGDREARTSLARRFREPFLGLTGASVLLLAALGLRFHREKAHQNAELDLLQGVETRLRKDLLPAGSSPSCALLQSLERQIEERGGVSGANGFPSALAFWAELAAHMPDVEALDLTLESLDFTPEGGRMSARVRAAKGDPLRNAAHLESEIDRSERLKAKGDYEVRDGQVEVRLRMEYRP